MTPAHPLTLGAPAHINAPRSGYHDQIGVIVDAILDRAGHPAVYQLQLRDGAHLWFGRAGLKPVTTPQETAA